MRSLFTKETFPLSYFSMTKRRVQGGVATSERRRRDGVYQKSSKDFPSLENLPASSRFALCKQPSPSGANIASEPSRYSLTTATGSKRSSADSDSLLCHVGLWRTSRLSFWQKYGCEHGEIGFVSAIYCSNTSSVAVNRATFSRRRRLIIPVIADGIFHFVLQMQCTFLL